MFPKLHLSPSSGEDRGTPNVFGPLERVKEPNTVGAPLPSRREIQFRKRSVFKYLELMTMDKVHKSQ
jgi:hypothetical protein